jgi:ferritin-like protein
MAKPSFNWIMQSYIIIYNVELVKTVGEGTAQGVKTGTEEVNKWFKSIGEGIEDLGRWL